MDEEEVRRDQQQSMKITIFPRLSSSMSEMSVEPRVESDDSLKAFGSGSSNCSREDDDNFSLKAQKGSIILYHSERVQKVNDKDYFKAYNYKDLDLNQLFTRNGNKPPQHMSEQKIIKNSILQ